MSPAFLLASRLLRIMLMQRDQHQKIPPTFNRCFAATEGKNTAMMHYGWRKPRLWMCVLPAGYTDTAPAARVELGNMDLEEQERSPKWEKLILEGGQLQENKIRRENGKQLSGKHCMHFGSCRQLLQEHLVSFSVSKAPAFS